MPRLRTRESMTQAEYDRRVAEIQADLMDGIKAENARHDAEVASLRADFRRRLLALHAGQEASA